VRNIEIKARLRDRARVEAELARIGAENAGVETQHDTFYGCPSGRLKLRDSSRDGAMLIHYVRSDDAAPRRSEYRLAPVADPESLRQVLDLALGGAGEVRKERHLYWVDNVRVHLDRVENLGEFLELEAIVDGDHPEDACARGCEELLVAFGIEPMDRIAVAYVDLLG
jgi:predicted adenylyl cyclase CyaB